jgi:leader peptidase (prepilin peptidase)/N-methyltransferase
MELTAADLPIWFVRVFAFAWGAVWGSFANVVIYRWPEEMSVVSPGSHCPHCGKPVRGYDNVPILAWLWLRGKCRDCKAPISVRYPAVEAVYACVALAIASRLMVADPSPSVNVAVGTFLLQFAFAWGLLTASFIDFETLLIPDFISIGGTVLCFLCSFVLPGIGWKLSLQGIALGFGIPFSLHLFWEKILKREGMGLGDAKLLAMIGALLGPLAVVFSMCAGSLQGLIAIGVTRAAGVSLGPEHPFDEAPAETPAETPAEATEKPQEATESAAVEDPGLMRTRIPFGPFLALGAMEFLLGAWPWVERLLLGGAP